MSEYMRTLQVGAATVTIINIGHLQMDLAAVLNLPAETQSSPEADLITEPVQLPVQCVHIALPEMSVLVDASRYHLPPDSSFLIPGYRPPPGLLAGLAELGLAPEEIAHVVITHAHFDHYNGTILEDNGVYTPAFPNARHYLGRPDWDRPETQNALRNPDSLESRTLAILHRQGLLELVQGNRDLGQGLQIIAAPGESPGHQMVRLHSQGQTLYCLGDLYHHPVEVEHPDWMVHWADRDATGHSRQSLVAAALAENALLIATHIPTLGRLHQTATGVTWIAAYPP